MTDPGPRAEIGVFGGSGFYQIADDVEELWVETPYGPPSDKISVLTIGGRKVAFLPRHGRDHRYPPHRVPYRANLWAMKSLGVSRIVGPCAAGSLQPDIPPGTFVLCDQFVNRTWGREDTYFEGPVVTHIGAADPYCPEMRQAAAGVLARLGIPHRTGGTVVVVQGPRFSTRAESREFREHGWHVINMTQYPEVILARELGMCYLNVSLVTDYDVGLEGHPEVHPVSHQEVLRVFNANLEHLRTFLWELVPAIPRERRCSCGRAVQEARGEPEVPGGRQ
ncbi:MAG: S-methyl-5'-thioadenosine phosphorylase [Limnochordaceae bacterium]|nr:S-methyl-5'-thioadenosine phosphorylase [Limnochordaceae bacterium]